MKLLLIHQFFITTEEPGGSRHQELARHFAREGHEVRVLAGSVNYMTNRSKLKFPRFYKKEIFPDFSVTWVYACPTLNLGLAGKVVSYLSFFVLALPILLREKPDIIVATSPPPTAAALGCFLSRLRKIPWIFEVRDLWPSSALDMKAVSSGPLTQAVEQVIDFLYRKANHLVTLTWGLEKSLMDSGVSAGKITTIPNGVDDAFLSEKLRVIPPLESLRSSGKFVVMYVGALGPANHLIRLLESALALGSDPRIHFVIVGDGREKMSLEQFAKTHAMDNVLFLAPVSRQDIPCVLRYADAGIVILAKVPAFRHAISNKLFDYMASGLPVVLALREGDAWDILEKAGGGVRADPDDAASIAKRIKYLFENREEAAAMGQRGKAYVMKHFLRKDLAKQYLRVIENLVANKVS